jgi:hypothetical protein
MPQPPPLDAIVRPVEKDDPIAAEEKRVVLDGKNNVVAPSFIPPLTARRYFLVHTRKAVSRSGLTVLLRALSGELTLQVGYQVRCAENGENTLVKAVASSANAQIALDDFVDQRLQLFAQGLGIDNFVQNFTGSCRAFREQLGEELKSRFGLLLIDLRVLPGEHALEARRVGPIVLQIRPRDVPITLDIELETTLNVDQRQLVLAHAKESELDGLAQYIVSAARELLMHLELHDLYTNLNGSVRERFLTTVAAVAAQHGRELSGTALRCQFERHEILRNVSRSLEHHVVFPYENPAHPSPIHIKASLNMKLVNVALLVQAGVTSLRDWIEETVRRVSNDLLFKLSYDEFCQLLETKKKDLEARMKAEARTIGYEVEHFYTLTDHQIDELLRGVELEELKNEFVLKSAKQLKVEVKISLKVRVLAEHLTRVMDRVVRNEDLKQAMRSCVWNATASYMRKLTPEDFYVYFEQPPEGKEYSHVQLMAEAIQSELLQRFGAEITEFVVTPLETAVTNLFDRLRKEPGEVKFEVQPQAHPVVRFSLAFSVENVLSDRWETFQAKTPELSGVGEEIKKQLSSELAALGGEMLMQEPRKVAEFAGLRVQIGMREVFGLNVRLTRFSRHPADWEIAAGVELNERYLTDVKETTAARLFNEKTEETLRVSDSMRLGAALAKAAKLRDDATEQRTIGNVVEAELFEEAARREEEVVERIRSASLAAARTSRERTLALGHAPHALTPTKSKEGARSLLEQSLEEAKRELGQVPQLEDPHAEGR